MNDDDYIYVNTNGIKLCISCDKVLNDEEKSHHKQEITDGEGGSFTITRCEVCYANFNSYPDIDELKSENECKACGGLFYWCRGCGGFNKRKAMKDYGIPDDIIEAIYDKQFGCCSLPFVPCYMCNITGNKTLKVDEKNKDFWKKET